MATACSTNADTGCPSNYTPQVGDEVKFEYIGKKYKGLIFNSADFGELCIASNCGTGRLRNVTNLKKIGHTNLVDNAKDYSDADPIAKAYFAQPTLTGTYAERQAQWIEHHGLKVGDKVKVVRKFENSEDGYTGGGWDNGYAKRNAQGNEMTIKRIDSGQIVLVGHGAESGNFFPYFALEPVK